MREVSYVAAAICAYFSRRSPQNTKTCCMYVYTSKYAACPLGKCCCCGGDQIVHRGVGGSPRVMMQHACVVVGATSYYHGTVHKLFYSAAAVPRAVLCDAWSTGGAWVHSLQVTIKTNLSIFFSGGCAWRTFSPALCYFAFQNIYTKYSRATSRKFRNWFLRTVQLHVNLEIGFCEPSLTGKYKWSKKLESINTRPRETRCCKVFVPNYSKKN